MNEEELAKQIQSLQELKKQNKEVDISTLALAALQRQSTNTLSPREKRWAYLIAIAFPPFGLLFAAKFYFSDKTDGKNAAYMCLALTVAAVILLIIINKVLFASLGGALEQTQPINPEDWEGLF